MSQRHSHPQAGPGRRFDRPNQSALRPAQVYPREERAPRQRRACVGTSLRTEFEPPEEWHEPQARSNGLQILVRPPGAGYRHVVTPDEIRARLRQLPPAFLRDLQVIQLSTMTRKKESAPCYGMQWGQAVYLYPLEESLTEWYALPPTPAHAQEARRYGARWKPAAGGGWELHWTASSARDYYLNNILIHEIGHLVDDRNTTPKASERFAEWFALEHGYKPTRPAGRKRRVRRRHG